MIESFEFIRPWWLLALLALIPLAIFWRSFASASAWENYISAEKLKHLRVSSTVQQPFARAITLTTMAIAIFALAGPSFSRIPQPVQQNRDAVVVVFDLSPSMLVNDVAPNRLTRARLKLIDLLRMRTEGETALIAYADDAYRIAPLTDDTRNIEALVPTLHPEIMPGAGSNTEAAISMALKLLTNADAVTGDIVLISDGVTSIARSNIAPTMPDGVTLSVIGVGTAEGAPIPGPGGSFLRDSNNAIVIAALDRTTLNSLAADHGGVYADLSNDDSDLVRILNVAKPDLESEFERATAAFDTRFDSGFWLALLLVPLGLIAFRRNLFWIVPVALLSAPMMPRQAHAFSWDDLWLRRDQQAARALESDDAQKASELFKNREWQGVADYRNGSYDKAAGKLGEGDGARHFYNQGNALALNEQYDKALESYREALKIDPDHENAKHNLEALEKLMQQQKQDQSQQQQGEDSKEGKSEDSEEDASSQSNNSQRQGDEKKEGESNPSNSSQGGSDQDTSADPLSDGEKEEKSEAEKQNDEKQTANETENKNAQDLKNLQQAQNMPEETPLSDMSEQWLRSLPQDPGGLMRRKFRYQSKIRARDNNPAAAGEKRY